MMFRTIAETWTTQEWGLTVSGLCEGFSFCLDFAVCFCFRLILCFAFILYRWRVEGRGG